MDVRGNIGKLYVLSNGQIKDPINLNSFHPLSTVNTLIVYLEDGGGDETATMINYKADKLKIPNSHNFPMLYRGLEEHTISGEVAPRTFAKYITYIPTIVSRYNVNSKTAMPIQITLTQDGGFNFVGIFADTTALNAYATPTELDTAYVTDNVDYGYYQYDGTIWEIMGDDEILSQINTKQYNMGYIQIQGGNAPAVPITTLTDEQYKLIWQYMETLAGQDAIFQEDLDNLTLYIQQEIARLEKNIIIGDENDWDFNDIIPDNIELANSRNTWCQVGNEIYVFGGGPYIGDGNFGSTIKKSYKYNLLTKEWTVIEEFPYGLSDMRAVHKDGYIYIMAVVPSLVDTGNVILKYNISTNSYEEITAPNIRIRYSSGAVLVDDDIYVFADTYYTNTPPTTLENLDYTTPYIYNITSDTWSVGEPSSELFDRGYAIYYNGLIYVQRSLKFQAYNPTTDSWVDTLTPPIYGIVHNGLFQEYDGKIFIGSGWQGDISDNSPYLQYYNVEQDKWYVATRLENNLKPIGYGSLALVNNKIFYIGGYSNEDSAVDNRAIRTFGIEKLQFKKFNEIDDTLDDLETFKNVTVPATYETIVNVDTKVQGAKNYANNGLSLKENLSNKSINLADVNDIKYPTTKAVKTEIDKKVNKTQTIIGIDLQDDILLNEFKTALGNATSVSSGLMTSQDKEHLDVLVALLENSDGNNVVDTIGEILAIFNNYPEGADLVSALSLKVDKVIGKGLSTNDYTNVDKNKVDLIETDGDGTKYFGDDGTYHDISSQAVESVNGKEGVVVLTQDDVDDGSTYKRVTDTEKSTWNNKVDKVSGKGLSTEDYTTTEKNKLSGIEAGAEVNVQSDWTQEVNTADDYIKNKPAIPTKTSDLTNDTGYINTEADPIFTAWDKSTGISITKSQITDLIEATQSLSGLMSATDKQRLDVLHALLEEDTANNVVDSINEVLAIFNNYPEGADLVSALAGKVDKNNAITAGTKTKITYDSKGLVTAGADLVESDIPALSPSKITQDANNRFVTDTEKLTWNAKQEPIPTITQAQINTGTATTVVTITPKLLRDNFYTESEIDNMIGDIENALDAILGV